MDLKTEAKKDSSDLQLLAAEKQAERESEVRRDREGRNRYESVFQPYDAAWNALDGELWSRDASRAAAAIERVVATAKALETWDGDQLLTEWLAWLPESLESQQDAASKGLALALAGTIETGVCSHDDAAALISLTGENHPCNQVARLRRAEPVVENYTPKETTAAETDIVDDSSGNVAEFLAQRRETIEAENEERRQINDAALAWDEQFTQPWNEAWESFEKTIESTYSKPGDPETIAALVDAIRRIVELAKGTEFEGHIRIAAERCQRHYRRDPTGEAFHLGDIGDRAVLTTVLAAALDSSESVEQLASELRVKSPFSGKSCRNEVEWAQNRGELPYVLEELVQDLRLQESYGERAAAQQAKVTGPLISGSKDSYYQRTAISYDEKGRSQAQEISAKPGVERLRLLCDADREAKWGSNWVVEQRAKFCLAEDVSVEQANAFSVDAFVRQISSAIESQDSWVPESRSMKAGRAFLKRLESDPGEFERFKEKATFVAEAIESHREEFRLLEGEWEREHGVALPKTIDDLVSMQIRIKMGAGRTFSDDASGNEMWGIIEGYLKGLKDREVSQNSPEPTDDAGAGECVALTADSIEELERKTPKLDRDNGQWVTNKRAAKSEGIETTSLGSYRNKGASNGDKTFGRDKDGRIWRRYGTPGSHPWYLKNSLVTAQKP